MPVELDLNDDRSEKIHYDFEDYPILVNKAHLSTYPNFSAPSHWHDSIEIVVVLSGFMNYNVNGKIIPMNPGEGAFVNSRQLHFGYSDEQECEFIFAVIHPILLCSSVAVEKDFVMPLVNNQNAAFLKLEKQNPIHPKVIEKNPEDIYLKEAKVKLEEYFKTGISISSHSISIHFEDKEDLNRILELLNLIEE